jgi:hypothetical protein
MSFLTMTVVSSVIASSSHLVFPAEPELKKAHIPSTNYTRPLVIDMTNVTKMVSAMVNV